MGCFPFVKLLFDSQIVDRKSLNSKSICFFFAKVPAKAWHFWHFPVFLGIYGLF